MTVYEKKVTKKAMNAITISATIVKRNVVKRPGEKTEYWVSYKRNRFDKSIYQHEIEIFKSGIFENFPKPRKSEIYKWVAAQNAISRQENAWIVKAAPKNNQTSLSRLLNIY